MAPSNQYLDRGRQDADRDDWPAVCAHLTAARERAREAGGDLELPDLDRLREAAWWLGRTEQAVALDEEIYHRLEDLGQDDDAARRALDLGLQWALRGDLVVAGAWLGRARRLLASLPDSPSQGYLSYAEAALALDLYSDPQTATHAAQTLLGLARTHDEPALRCLARVLQGLAAVQTGEVQTGFDALDEAMLDVMAGRLPPLWSGDIFCTSIHVSQQLGDWERMRAWTRVLERWSTPLSRTFLYAAVTRLHQLELAAAQGDWDRVEAEMAERSEDLVGAHGWLAGAGFHELGEVRRLRGDLAGAAAAYERSRELGTDPQPGAARLACTQGRPKEALAQLRLALSGGGRLHRARLLLPTVETALLAGDVDLARACAAELVETAGRYRTPELRARAAHATALLDLRRGRYDEAVGSLELALTLYREQGLQLATAQVHEALAQARRGLGDDPGAAADHATALAAYRRLGAVPDVERLTGSERPGGLTAREEEILACVAGGASNREVAERLVISEKTVSRHLANIFAKLDVGSRTAAAAWAHQHGVHGTPHTAD